MELGFVSSLGFYPTLGNVPTLGHVALFAPTVGTLLDESGNTLTDENNNYLA